MTALADVISFRGGRLEIVLGDIHDPERRPLGRRHVAVVVFDSSEDAVALDSTMADTREDCVQLAKAWIGLFEALERPRTTAWSPDEVAEHRAQREPVRQPEPTTHRNWF